MKTASVALDNELNDETSSLVTCVQMILTQYQPQIAGITSANPAVITTKWAHDRETGDSVRLAELRGDFAALNRNIYQITKIDDFSFSIDVDASAFDPYTIKGVAQRVRGFTGHDEDLTIDGVLYQSTLGYSPESISQGANLQTDSIDLQGILQNAAKMAIDNLTIDGISDEDVIAGFYDGALISKIFGVNYEDLSQGEIIYPISGRLGKVSLSRGTYKAELANKAAPLQETLQGVYSNVCRADLGDDLDMSEPEHRLQQGKGCKVRLDPPVWRPSKAYTVRPAADAGLGSVVKPTIYIGRQFKCSTAGTSGLVEPAWNPTIGGTTIDGTAVWTTIEALTKNGVVYQAIDRRRWIDNDRNEAPIAGIGGASTLFPIVAVNTGAHRFTIGGNLAGNFPINNRFTVVGSAQNDGTYTVQSANNSGGNTLIVVGEGIPSGSANGSIVGRLGSLVGFFTYGRVTFLTGRNKGIAREVKTFSVTSSDGVTFTGPGAFEVFDAFPFDIEAGDTYEASAGCDKSLTLCRDKLDNVNNRRAEDFIPGMDSMLLYPDAK